MKILLTSFLITLAVVFCTSLYFKEETPVQIQTQYTVKNGDTLYSIAEEYGIKDWRKWAYEVCKNNDLKQGGLIYPGQTIMIEVTQ